jgi:hypothetical protein
MKTNETQEMGRVLCASIELYVYSITSILDDYQDAGLINTIIDFCI